MLSYIIALFCLKIILTDASEGKATYYGGNEKGNACGFSGVDKATFPFGYYAATGNTNFNEGYGCGKCFRITCLGAYPDDASNPSCLCSSSTPSVTVQTLDQCPECSASHFDLNPTAMQRIVAPGLAGTCGVIRISYERVACGYTKPFTVRNKGGTSKWWYGMHLDNLAGPGDAVKVDLLKDGSKIGECNKGQGPSFWMCSPSNGEYPNPPLDIKLYGDADETVLAENCITSWNGDSSMICNDNFGGLNGGGSNPVTPAPTTTTTTRNGDNNGGNSGGNSGVTVKIENKVGLNQWWYAVIVTASDGVTVISVKMKGNGMTSYEEGISDWDYYFFEANRPYKPPFSFKVKLSNGETLIGTNVINTLNVNDASASEGELSEKDTFFVDDVNESKSSWAVWFAVCVIILIVIAVILISVFCIVKKRKNKIEVGFDEKYANDAIDNKDDENEEQQEIEVDVQLTTTNAP